MKKVFVSGCFDMLHSGHVAFLEEAASYGDLYVGLGSDKTVFDLKGKPTINKQDERLYMIKSLKSVKGAWINTGNGLLDFEEELKSLDADIFFVNEDGQNEAKQQLCKKLGLEYIVSNRIPYRNLPGRSTTQLRSKSTIPYRIDLAGGWLDQPYVSRYSEGAVITISIVPDHNFNDRSGMSTSTRKKAVELWQTSLPKDNLEQNAKVLFCYENPPGSEYISGSQDSIGIVFPGINYLWYEKEKYWPARIDSITDARKLDWLEKRLFLIALPPRKNDLIVTKNSKINKNNAEALALAAENLWEAFLRMDSKAFGKAMTDSFVAQFSLFPNMVNDVVKEAIEKIPSGVLGYKLSGAGGGGYMVVFSEEEIEDTLRVRIRRN